jgi:tetratricopeptide (TPR) repeat protein
MARLWNRRGFSFSRLKTARLSAAKARVSRRAAREERTVWQRIGQALATAWKLLVTAVLSLVSVLTFMFIGALLWDDLTEKTIAISPIAVPRILAENGYTADVAAQRLQDALKKVADDAHAEHELEVLQQADIPSIVVPTVGLSLETIASDIRTYFQIDRRRNISGEITNLQNQLWLRLRIDGQFIITSDKGVDPEHPDDLLAPAAEKVFEQTDPSIAAAASLRDPDSGKSLEIAKHNESAPWAHNMEGIILSHQHKTKEAIAEYQKAIELDPHLAAAHHNLAVSLREQGQTEEAIGEYRKAIELDPRLAAAHQNLAIILRTQGNAKEADAEDQKAKQLGAKHPD